MHFYQFHIGDYKSHTHHLSLIEDLAFRRLLDHYYLHELPIRQRDIARQIGMKDHEQEVLTVLEEFFLSTENGYIHTRADEEIAKYRKLSEDGKRGAAKRWLKGGDSPPIAAPIATKNQEPITNNHKPIKKETVVSLPDGFPIETWMAFVDMRKKTKKVMTDHAMKLMIGKLEKMKASGQNIQAVLEQSITRSWSDVYHVKEQQVYNKPADIVHQTTPTPVNHDAALRKIEADRKLAAPMPDSVRDLVAKLKVKHD
jgi:uncharacterized protein YdaU (DUF1376 family)